jgi:ABC-type Na+ efflux pump permease subunit
MYSLLLFLHSFLRWLVLGSLAYSIYIAYMGKSRKLAFSASDNKWRHWTATISHVQLLLGMAMYVQSPVVMFKLLDNPNKLLNEQTFFRYFHIGMMLLAVVLVTIGSAKAKRQKTDQQKFDTMLVWFCLALMVILIAIPWPFSPLTSRPYIRNL